MNDRERFLAVLNFEEPDQYPLVEFMGFWPEVKTAWVKQGFPPKADIFEHFGIIEPKYIPINFNFVPPFEEKVLEDTEHHQIVIDETGVTKKIEKNSSAMPHYVDFPIKKRADFEALKDRLDPLDYKNRYPQNWPQLVAEYKNRTSPLGLVIRGPFAFCRDFMKFEDMMMTVYDDRKLIEDMMALQIDFIIKLWQKVLADMEVDFVYIGEDMAYKTGPMFSPAMCTQLLKPLYTKLTSALKSMGVKNIFLDSDGHVTDLIPLYIESGMTAILPLECTAGMDIVQVRQQYPNLQLIGGVDKMNIAQGDEGIKEELRRVSQIIRKGGYIPSFDHSVPPIVSLENYTKCIDGLKEILAS